MALLIWASVSRWRLPIVIDRREGIAVQGDKKPGESAQRGEGQAGLVWCSSGLDLEACQNEVRSIDSSLRDILNKEAGGESTHKDKICRYDVESSGGERVITEARSTIGEDTTMVRRFVTLDLSRVIYPEAVTLPYVSPPCSSLVER